MKEKFILPLAGYPIASATAISLGTMLKERLIASKQTALLFANTNFILKCQTLRTWLNSDNIILVNDGVGLDIAARIIHGQRFIENLNGTDFLPYFLKNFVINNKIYLIGGKPGVAEEAAKALEQHGQIIVGCMDGYTHSPAMLLCEKINLSGAEIILIAMGNPIQEEWIHTHMNQLNAKLFVGVGALFDFLAGNVKRAPRWIQRIRCEWIYRLLQEPKRLMRRYTLDIVSFLYLCLRYPVQIKK